LMDPAIISIHLKCSLLIWLLFRNSNYINYLEHFKLFCVKSALVLGLKGAGFDPNPTRIYLCDLVTLWQMFRGLVCRAQPNWTQNKRRPGLDLHRLRPQAGASEGTACRAPTADTTATVVPARPLLTPLLWGGVLRACSYYTMPPPEMLVIFRRRMRDMDNRNGYGNDARIGKGNGNGLKTWPPCS
ncbi:MAG: hypothetical protein ABIF71_03370, partial [Planctomycetota bacterium]